MSEYRKALESILLDKVRVTVVDVDKQFIHLDKAKGSWRMTISKSLLEVNHESKV